MTEQHQARLALEVAMEKLFNTEKSLIEGNSILPDVARLRGHDAALELVQMVVDQKIKSLSAATIQASDSTGLPNQTVS